MIFPWSSKAPKAGIIPPNRILPLGMIESLTFAGDPIGIALSPGPVDESLCHLGDDMPTGYIRSDERINGVAYPSVKSWSLWEYAKQHMEHGDNDDAGAGVDDLVEAPLPAFRQRMTVGPPAATRKGGEGRGLPIIGFPMPSCNS